MALKLPLYSKPGTCPSESASTTPMQPPRPRALRRGNPDLPLSEKLDALRTILRELESVVIGFSGGVDSTFLLKIAHEELGDNCVALTAVSPSLPERERSETVRLAEQIGARHVLRESDEIHNPAYKANPTDRCYHCKTALFDLADVLQTEHDYGWTAIGTNLNDLGEHRPGLKAAHERGVLSPMVEAGMTKADIREASKLMGLDTWNKPEFACLSSRFPYGTPITTQRLEQVETCEDVLHSLGFEVFRVRYHDEVVRIELGQEEIMRAFDPELRPEIIERCKKAGFKYISIDLQGYRRGSMNE